MQPRLLKSASVRIWRQWTVWTRSEHRQPTITKHSSSGTWEAPDDLARPTGQARTSHVNLSTIAGRVLAHTQRLRSTNARILLIFSPIPSSAVYKMSQKVSPVPYATSSPRSCPQPICSTTLTTSCKTLSPMPARSSLSVASSTQRRAPFSLPSGSRMMNWVSLRMRSSAQATSAPGFGLLVSMRGWMDVVRLCIGDFRPIATRLRTWRYKHRSEEHTSELQSHVNLVCRLLLEKKKYRP